MDKLIYEAIPPPISWPEGKINEWTRELFAMLETENIRSISLPEVIEETRTEDRTIPFLEKVDNLDYAFKVKNELPAFNPIPNKICVRVPKDRLKEWAAKAAGRGIRDIVLVGGERSDISYPGPTVKDAAAMIKSAYPDINLGGITIFTRKREAERILEKMESGIDFFVSQILFETSNAKCVLLNLMRLCRQQNRRMPTIFLSFAAVSTKIELDFMQWLGVEFPTGVRSYLMDHGEEEISGRVKDVLNFTLEDFFRFISHYPMDIGVNVEQIMYKSIDSGRDLLRLVKEKMKAHAE